ncbi:ORF10 [Bat coronavirus RacCS203]|uniref:ORF10 n=4 Tax=unclassified Sarbecovirus TaxID=2720068 RepID=A0A7U3VI40_9BETC|nr:ORF10 [Bat coronavirus RacCS203]QQM18884.1 ORF10 [Bat coronavirus RacCS224]QQM18895.1 ORF10 [Bat coronavirus RacCS253]QQM18906.1 ORF10 [Bat coronavirus RacCS264]QQM18917.1 ORF10 [Bat coronavirus RacCS271]QSI74364.1 truncated ORF10 protein [Severe acute respiratory syndrome coronavirus 2]
MGYINVFAFRLRYIVYSCAE